MAKKEFTAAVALTKCVTLNENLKSANSTVTNWLREQKKLPQVLSLMWQHRDTLLEPLCQVVEGLTPNTGKNMFMQLMSAQVNHLNKAMYGTHAEEGTPEYEISVGYWGSKNVGRTLTWKKDSVEYKVTCTLLGSEGKTKVPVWKPIKKDSWTVALLWKVLCQSYSLDHATFDEYQAPVEEPVLMQYAVDNMDVFMKAVGLDEVEATEEVATEEVSD